MGKRGDIPRVDAFALYVSLGTERSYARVAEHYGVSKVAVQKAASRERWTERLRSIEGAASRRVEAELAESMAEMRTRHLKVLRAVHQRALEGLRDHRLASCIEAVKALEAAIKLEREIARDPVEESAAQMQERAQREEDEFVVEEREPDEDGDDWPVD